MERSPTQSFAIVGALVTIAALVSWAGSQQGATVNGYPVFMVCGVMAFVINWLVFVPSNLAKSEKFYDLTGSVTYVSVIVLAVTLSNTMDTRSMLVALMVMLWAVRLGCFLFSRISQDGHDDRFDAIKVNPLRFFTAWSIQALWVLLTSACALAIITSAKKHELGVVGFIGITLWSMGFIIEVVADSQKRRFRKKTENNGRFIDSGLWAWSQHPNYFGEIVMWVAIAVIATPILQGWQWVCLISPVFVYLLLTKVSGIPLLQKKGASKWGHEPAYQSYILNTPLLVPKPPQKG